MPIPKELMPQDIPEQEPDISKSGDFVVDASQEQGSKVTQEQENIKTCEQGNKVTKDQNPNSNSTIKQFNNLTIPPKKHINFSWMAKRLLPIFIIILLLSVGAIAAVPSWRNSFNKFISKWSPKADEMPGHGLDKTLQEKVAVSQKECSQWQKDLGLKISGRENDHYLDLQNNPWTYPDVAYKCEPTTEQKKINEQSKASVDEIYPYAKLSVIGQDGMEGKFRMDLGRKVGVTYNSDGISVLGAPTYQIEIPENTPSGMAPMRILMFPMYNMTYSGWASGKQQLKYEGSATTKDIYLQDPRGIYDWEGNGGKRNWGYDVKYVGKKNLAAVVPDNLQMYRVNVNLNMIDSENKVRDIAGACDIDQLTSVKLVPGYSHEFEKVYGSDGDGYTDALEISTTNGKPIPPGKYKIYQTETEKFGNRYNINWRNATMAVIYNKSGQHFVSRYFWGAWYQKDYVELTAKKEVDGDHVDLYGLFSEGGSLSPRALVTLTGVGKLGLMYDKLMEDPLVSPYYLAFHGSTVLWEGLDRQVDQIWSDTLGTSHITLQSTASCDKSEASVDIKFLKYVNDVIIDPNAITVDSSGKQTTHKLTEKDGFYQVGEGDIVKVKVHFYKAFDEKGSIEAIPNRKFNIFISDIDDDSLLFSLDGKIWNKDWVIGGFGGSWIGSDCCRYQVKEPWRSNGLIKVDNNGEFTFYLKQGEKKLEKTKSKISINPEGGSGASGNSSEKGIEFGEKKEAPEVAIDSICTPKEQEISMKKEKKNKVFAFFQKIINKIFKNDIVQAEDKELECADYVESKPGEEKQEVNPFFPGDLATYKTTYTVPASKDKDKPMQMVLEVPKLAEFTEINTNDSNQDWYEDYKENLKYINEKLEYEEKDGKKIKVTWTFNVPEKDQKVTIYFKLKLNKKIGYDDKELKIKVYTKNKVSEAKVESNEVELGIWAYVRGLITGPYDNKLIPGVSLVLYDGETKLVAGTEPGKDEDKDPLKTIVSWEKAKEDKKLGKWNMEIPYDKNLLKTDKVKIGVNFYNNIQGENYQDNPRFKFYFDKDEKKIAGFRTTAIDVKTQFKQEENAIRQDIKIDIKTPDPAWEQPEEKYVDMIEHLKSYADVWYNLYWAWKNSKDLAGIELKNDKDDVIVKWDPDFKEENFCKDKKPANECGSYIADKKITLNSDSLSLPDKRYPFDEYHQFGHILIEKLYGGKMEAPKVDDFVLKNVKDPNIIINYTHGEYLNDFTTDSLLEGLCKLISSEYYHKILAHDDTLYTLKNYRGDPLTDLREPGAIFSDAQFVTMDENGAILSTAKFENIKKESDAIAGLLNSLLDHGSDSGLPVTYKTSDQSVANTIKEYINPVKINFVNDKGEKKTAEFNYELKYKPEKNKIIDLKKLLAGLGGQKIVTLQDAYHWLKCTVVIGQSDYNSFQLANVPGIVSLNIPMINALDQLFVLFGAFHDDNGNWHYDWGETIGSTSAKDGRGALGNVKPAVGEIMSSEGNMIIDTLYRRDWRK